MKRTMYLSNVSFGPPQQKTFFNINHSMSTCIVPQLFHTLKNMLLAHLVRTAGPVESDLFTRKYKSQLNRIRTLRENTTFIFIFQTHLWRWHQVTVSEVVWKCTAHWRLSSCQVWIHGLVSEEKPLLKFWLQPARIILYSILHTFWASPKAMHQSGIWANTVIPPPPLHLAKRKQREKKTTQRDREREI